MHNIIFNPCVFFPAQGNFVSSVRAEVAHMQSAEQRGGHQPRAGKCVHQRGLGTGDTGRMCAC